jgi:hypothetical protein
VRLLYAALFPKLGRATKFIRKSSLGLVFKLDRGPLDLGRVVHLRCALSKWTKNYGPLRTNGLVQLGPKTVHATIIKYLQIFANNIKTRTQIQNQDKTKTNEE